MFIRVRFAALLLLLAIAALSPAGQASLPITLTVVVAGVLLNTVAWLLLRYARLAGALALAATAADSLFLLYFIAATGGSQSPLWALVFLLIGATSLRYGLPGGLVIACLFGFSQLASGVWESGATLAALYAPAVRGLAFVLMALLVGWVVGAESRRFEQELQRQRFDLDAFAKLTGTMTTNTNYQITLQQMLDLCSRGLRARDQVDGEPVGLILLFEAGEAQSLFVAAQHGLEPPDDTRHLKPLQGAIKTSVQTVQPVTVDDARRDPLLSQFNVVGQQCRSALILPLAAGLNLYGVAVFVGAEQLLETFAHRRSTMEAYARQAAIAVHNAQLYVQLAAEHDRVVDSEEKVRHEVARDLHDGPINSVASLTMGIDFARTLLQEDPARAKQELDNLHRLAAKTARDMRLTMYRLRPLALESAGLSAALEQYIARLQGESAQTQFHFDAPDASQFESRLSSNSKTMVFDIIKEAVGNALKHAGAQNIRIGLRLSGDWLIATVVDDGKGFDVNAVQTNSATRGSLGMLNIQERAALARGDAQVESAPGKGTTVTVRVPLEQ